MGTTIFINRNLTTIVKSWWNLYLPLISMASFAKLLLFYLFIKSTPIFPIFDYVSLNDALTLFMGDIINCFLFVFGWFIMVVTFALSKNSQNRLESIQVLRNDENETLQKSMKWLYWIIAVSIESTIVIINFNTESKVLWIQGTISLFVICTFAFTYYFNEYFRKYYIQVVYLICMLAFYVVASSYIEYSKVYTNKEYAGSKVFLKTEHYNSDKKCYYYQDSTICCSNSQFFIGQTKDYVFIYDSVLVDSIRKNSRITVFKRADISKIEF